MSIAEKIGCVPQTLHEWVKKAEVNSGKRAGVSTEVADKMKALEREVRELRQANEILRWRRHIVRRRSSTARSGDDRLHRRSSRNLWGRADLPCPADRPIDVFRACRAAAGSDTPSARARQDAALKPKIARVFAENFAVFGVRKVWRQMIREGVPVARCTVARLMREMGLASVIRGKPVRATISDKAAPCPLDHVNRQF